MSGTIISIDASLITKRLAAFLLPVLVLLSCKAMPDVSDEHGSAPDTEKELVVVDGKVRFRVSLDEIPEEFFRCGILSHDLSGRTVRIGSRDYPVMSAAQTEWGGMTAVTT